MILRALFLICCAFDVPVVHAEKVYDFNSQSHQTTMIELYSSQGCSSCPPAERWMSRFIDDENLWKTYIPIVFHVDYWNDLGWVDPFSNAQNSQRQRNYYKQGKVSSVYTPGFIVNGEEWRGGEYTTVKTHPGLLRASLAKRKLNVSYENKGDFVLHVSVLGVGLKTDVSRGENSGKILQEDFVALTHQSFKSDKGHWKIELPDLKIHTARRYGLAIWLSKLDENAPIQSVGGWLPENVFNH